MKPQALANLRHDKILTAGNFPTFVETFNWLVRFADNLRGEFDKNQKEGLITLDRSDEDHPVIRFRKDNLKISASSGSVTPGCFDIEIVDNARKIVRCYYRNGHRFYQLNDATLSNYATTSTPIVAIKEDMNYGVSFCSFASWSALQSAQEDLNYAYLPLYKIKFTDGDYDGVEVDFRNMAAFSVTEG